MAHPGPHALALGRRSLAPPLVAERYIRDLACRIPYDAGQPNDLDVPLPPARLLEFRLFKLGDPLELRREDVEGEEPLRRSSSSIAPEGSRPAHAIPSRAIGRRTRPVPHPSSSTGPPVSRASPR